MFFTNIAIIIAPKNRPDRIDKLFITIPQGNLCFNRYSNVKGVISMTRNTVFMRRVLSL